MRPNPSTPSLARLAAFILGLALSATVLLANAQTLPDIQHLMKQGQMQQALEKVDVLIATKPKDATGRFLKGLILTEIGRPAEAILVFAKLTEDFPELPEPYNNLAVLYAQQKQYDKARSALEMAIRTHPSYSIAHENLGDVYAKLASQAYGKALQLDASNTVMQTKLSMITELISTSSKPGTKPAASAARPSAESAKIAATEAPKPPSTGSKPLEKTAEKAPEPAPVVKAPEPTIVTKAAQKTAVAGTREPKAAEEKNPPAANEADLGKALRGWASAWSSKDVKAYLGYYASDFQLPTGMTRKAWEAERTQRIDKPGKLQVNVDNVKISQAGDKATVKFRQHYTSATLKSSTNKTIIFVKSGSKWLIQQERVG